MRAVKLKLSGAMSCRSDPGANAGYPFPATARIMSPQEAGGLRRDTPLGSGSLVRQVQHGAKGDAHGAQYDDNSPQKTEQAQVLQGKDLGQGQRA